jgi:hypothetical protein
VALKIINWKLDENLTNLCIGSGSWLLVPDIILRNVNKYVEVDAPSHHLAFASIDHTLLFALVPSQLLIQFSQTYHLLLNHLLKAW